MDSLPLWFVPVGMSALLLIVICNFKFLLNWQRLLAEASIALALVGFPFLFLAGVPIIATCLLAVFNLWLLLLGARLIFGRLGINFLHASTIFNATVILAAVSVVLLWVWFMAPVGLDEAATTLLAFSVLAGVVFSVQTIWTYGHYRIKLDRTRNDEDKLPTVSLCIPARNEDNGLSECLLAAVASDYPKLEILVLDDCSQDKTSEIIRTFAHDGVRFVKGDLPADGWLGRNQAMNTLAKNASGKVLIFMGVDTVLSSHSISALVKYAQSKADMVSVLPYSNQRLAIGTVFNNLRYYWELVVPISKRHIPSSTKLWLIEAAALKKLGGFDSVRHKIIPEKSFAKRLMFKKEYRFVVSDAALGATSAKTWNDHTVSALRVFYPTLKRQPIFVLAAIAWLLGVCILPFAVLVVNFTLLRFDTMFWLSVAACGLFMFSHALIMSRLQPASWLTSTLLLPALFVQELGLVVVSMLAYEFSEVNWKGRNVCYPVISQGLRSAAAVSELGQKSHASPE
jgi:glycosyltransferase involved in cell wall biosynthesis